MSRRSSMPRAVLIVSLVVCSVVTILAPASAHASSTLLFRTVADGTQRIQWMENPGTVESLGIRYEIGADATPHTADDTIVYTATTPITIAASALGRCTSITVDEAGCLVTHAGVSINSIGAEADDLHDTLRIDEATMTSANLSRMQLVYMAGGAGDDDVIGGPADEWLYGGSGDDFVWGGDGDDHLEGGTGADEVRGEGGNDAVVAKVDSAADQLLGGTGTDVLSYALSSQAVTMHLGEPAAGNTDQDVTDNSFEELVGSELGDVLSADADASREYVHGGAGNDRLISRGLHARLLGGPGIDAYDEIGAFSASISYDDDLAAIEMTGASVTVDGGGVETLPGSIREIIGTAFADTMAGRAGIVDLLSGGDGDDTLDLRDGLVDGAGMCGAGADTIRMDVGAISDPAPNSCELINPVPPIAPVPDPRPPADPAPPAADPGGADPRGDDEMRATLAAPSTAQITLFEPLRYGALARRKLITTRFPVEAAGVRSVVRIRVYPRQARQMGLRVPSGQQFMVLGSAVAHSTRAGNLVVRPRLTFRARQALARTARRRSSPRRIAVHLDVLVQQGARQSRVIRGFTLRR